MGDILKRSLYKIDLSIIKVIPFMIALCQIINISLSYIGIEVTYITYIAGIGLLPLLFIWVSSFVFRFCIYHRIPIYYTFVNNILCTIDYEYGIPVTARELLLMNVLIIGMFICMFIFFKFKLFKR